MFLCMLVVLEAMSSFLITNLLRNIPCKLLLCLAFVEGDRSSIPPSCVRLVRWTFIDASMHGLSETVRIGLSTYVYMSLRCTLEDEAVGRRKAELTTRDRISVC